MMRCPMSESRELPWKAYPVYRPVRRAPTAALIATLAVVMAGHVLFWTVEPVSDALDRVAAWSGQLVQPTLAINVLEFAVLVAVWFGAFGLRGPDVGVHVDRLSAGLRVLVGGWLGIQVIRVIAAVIVDRRVDTVNGGWIVGAIAGQVLGNALVEEIVHRGLMLPQLYDRIHARSERRRLVAAVVEFRSLSIARLLIYGHDR